MDRPKPPRPNWISYGKIFPLFLYSTLCYNIYDRRSITSLYQITFTSTSIHVLTDHRWKKTKKQKNQAFPLRSRHFPGPMPDKVCKVQVQDITTWHDKTHGKRQLWVCLKVSSFSNLHSPFHCSLSLPCLKKERQWTARADDGNQTQNMLWPKP